MILIIQVISVNDESYKVLVLVVAAILVVSLVINAFLASDPRSFSSPPVRVGGYFTGHGDPLPGYYIEPGQYAATYGMIGEEQSCK
jgi:hypothetical protein